MTQILDVISEIAKTLKAADWILIAVVISAFAAPYFIERWKSRFYRPRLLMEFEFGTEFPYSHQTFMKVHETGVQYPVYYFLFSVRNRGRSPAEDCEAVLERIWEIGGEGKPHEWKRFLPLNLKWSGERPKEDFRRACFKAIYPGNRNYYCDIGRITDPGHKDFSQYGGATSQDQQKNKFLFELPLRLYSQWDCLLKGSYKIQISVYAKNTKPVTKNIPDYLDWRLVSRGTGDVLQRNKDLHAIKGNSLRKIILHPSPVFS